MIIFDGVNDVMNSLTLPVWIAIGVVSLLILVCSVFAIVFGIMLPIKYMRFNKKQTARGVAGKDVARDLLDKYGMEKIKVKKANIFTAFMVGNSYSHFFKRVRLRGLIYNKDSLTSVAIAGQKVGLAKLDKDGDKDMKRRIWLLPFLTFLGPWAFILLVVLGIVLDVILFKFSGVLFLSFSILGVLFYLFCAFYQFIQLKTEKKAQDVALDILVKENYLTAEEVKDAKELYKVYNLNYIFDIIISILEAILQILKIVLMVLSKSSSSSSSSN